MAATTEHNSPGRGRPNSRHIFLVGHVLLVFGYIFFTVGFATDHWLTTATGWQYGLWEFCPGYFCDDSDGDFTDWMRATRGMQTLALLCYMGGVLVALFLHCVAHIFPAPTIPRVLHGKARALEISTGVGCAFCLIGVSVYGGKGDKVGTLDYSYALTVFSLFLSVPGTIMVAVTRNAVTIHSQSARVSPHSGTSIATVTDSRFSQGQPQTTNGDSFPFGRGQHRPEQPGSGGGGFGFNENPYPYGGGPAPFSPNSLPQPLPYSMHPEEAGSAGIFGTISMAEQGPVGGEGRGSTGGGCEPPRGQSRAPSRLPPITEVSPSAPPLPPPDSDQPPSYLEAIGHTYP